MNVVSRAASLGVVVVHYSAPDLLRRCLTSVVEDASAVDRRIVVVDNSAASLPCGTAARIGGGEVVAVPENPGFGSGVNRGVAHLDRTSSASLDGFVILNHDVEIQNRYLEAAAAALATGCGAAAGPVVLDSASGPLWYGGGDVAWLTGTLRPVRRGRSLGGGRSAGFVTGAAMAIARDAWLDVGGFDPAIFLYHEDVDLSLRLRRAGWSLRYEPGMRAVHHMGASTGSRQRSALYLENMARFRFRPFRSRSYRTYLAVLHTGWVMARGTYLALRDHDGRRARALWRGHAGALRFLWSRDGGPTGRGR
jgi:GT2 family glycosyltransferase